MDRGLVADGVEAHHLRLGHPQIKDGDATFHADNLGRVLNGDWYITSATPPPAIAFPYPQGLSAAALPFSGAPRDQWVTVLRTVVLIAEVGAGFAFAVVVASLSTPAVGAVTFALLALASEGLVVLFIGNLANQFADALMILGCAFLMAKRTVLGFLSLLGAFLSHLGAVLVGAPLAFLLTLALAQGDTWSARWRRITPVLLALLAAFVLLPFRPTGAGGALRLGPMCVVGPRGLGSRPCRRPGRRDGHRRSCPGPGLLPVAAAVMFLSWIGAYVTSLNPGGAVHVLLLVSGVFLVTHFRRKKASLFAIAPGEILSLQLGLSRLPHIVYWSCESRTDVALLREGPDPDREGPPTKRTVRRAKRRRRTGYFVAFAFCSSMKSQMRVRPSRTSSSREATETRTA